MKSIAIAAAIVLGVAGTAVAQKGSPPKIDIQRVCQAGASEIIAVFGNTDQDVLGTCIQDEEQARDQLVQNWGSFPDLARERCVQPNEYLPSYVEWTACLEITRDVIKMRQERAAAVTAGGYENRDCPIVKFSQEGNILSVDACPLGHKR